MLKKQKTYFGEMKSLISVKIREGLSQKGQSSKTKLAKRGRERERERKRKRERDRERNYNKNLKRMLVYFGNFDAVSKQVFCGRRIPRLFKTS